MTHTQTPKAETGDTFEGPIIVTGKGHAFFNVEKDLSIEIPAEAVKKAFWHDSVRVRVTSKDGGRDGAPTGEVEEILKRNKVRYVGTSMVENGELIIKPDTHRMYINFIIPKEERSKHPDLRDNTKVYIEFIGWQEDSPYPQARILKVIGPKGVHEVEMQSIILEQGFETGFAPEIEEEAANFKAKWEDILKEELGKRKDIREKTTLTIDPFDARDFDDALSFEKLPNGNYEIGVHIADVSYFVRPGSKLDKEAFDRAFSVYLVDRTIPMLPEILSNELCSLNPNVERLAFSAIFEVTPDAEVKDQWFGRSVIKSDKRFTYESAQEVLDKKDGEYYEELNILNTLAKKLTAKKLAHGAIRFERDEFEFELDKDGVPIKVIKKEHLDTHSLIEEFMLLANRHVAKYIFDTDKKMRGGNLGNMMYRVHSLPDPDKLKDLSQFVKAMGYKLELKKDGTISPATLNNLLKEVEDKPGEQLISTAAVKTMSKALYSTENQGHFGLAFDYYTHFTSPIRRYPDLIVHRILDKLLAGEKVSDEDMVYYQKAAEHSSEQEVNAQEAERQSIKYKQVEFMMNHIGEEFDGVISGVSKFGVFVVLNDTGAVGMIHISKLGNDFFRLDEKNYRVVGEKSKKTYSLADPVRVKIEEANLEEKQLQMSLV